MLLPLRFRLVVMVHSPSIRLVCPPTLSAVFQVEELCGDLCGLEPVHSTGITESGGWLRVWLHLLVWYYICLFWTLGVMGLST